MWMTYVGLGGQNNVVYQQFEERECECCNQKCIHLMLLFVHKISKYYKLALLYHF